MLRQPTAYKESMPALRAVINVAVSRECTVFIVLQRVSLNTANVLGHICGEVAQSEALDPARGLCRLKLGRV